MNGDITLDFRSTLTLAKCCWSNISVHYFCCFRCVISPL